VLRRIEGEELAGGVNAAYDVRAAEPVVARVGEADLDAGQLPHDHPQWVRDAVAISRAARALVGRLRPIVLKVLTFWDHGIRTIAIGGRRIGVDASGSYRIEP
jgi:hypothetical protein